MLKRIYIDNFRCLANFELRLDPITLLLGTNGSGKSSVFEVVRRLRDFVIGDARIHDVFPGTDLTRWRTDKHQRFELDMEAEEDLYTYTLVIDHDFDRRRLRVAEEKLDMNGKPLAASKGDSAQLYRDDHSEGPQHPFDWSRSLVGFLHERADNRKLARFKRELAKLIVVRPIPFSETMERESRGEDEHPAYTMKNFVSWYRHLVQEHTGAMMTLHGVLRSALPGFDSLSLKEFGEDARALKALFAHPGGGKPMTFDFADLSDGQRMLILLYTLVFGLKDEGISLLIDEPDNFLALREIQPWLSNLADEVGDSVEQAVLISHHPDIINYLGGAHGRWLERDGQGPVRIADVPRSSDGISLAETVARGWER